MPLPIDVYLGALRREGDGLAAAAENRLDAAVVACPGWDVADLVWHAGEVFSFWATVAEGAEGPDVHEPDRPPRPEVVGWYRSQLERLERVLTDADPLTPCWTCAGSQTVAWIQRRMAQETAVHRCDAQAEPDPIDPVLAVDGIDEFLELFLETTPNIEGTVHLHATDAEGEWLIRTAPGRPIEVERGHAKGDVAVRATASDLLLLLWRRRALADGGFEVFGDASLAETFVAASSLE
ncbi:MAG: maleylpyruvate isomerase family mycothiol-dependent enzyme [Actinomycetota bacterium]